MPGFYADGEYDIAGFIVGVVERARLITGATIKPGDVLIGVPSTGLHTNGYSLARRIAFDHLQLKVDSFVPELNRSIGEALLEPHRSYLALVKPVLATGLIKGMAHITGGGITENLPRILPEGMAARVLHVVVECSSRVYVAAGKRSRSDVRHDAHVQHGDRVDRRGSPGPGGPGEVSAWRERIIGEIVAGRAGSRVRAYDSRPVPGRRLGVLISGRGSNLQALIDAVANRRLDATISVVISNREDAGGLDRARRAGIETICLSHRGWSSRDDYDRALVKELQKRRVDLVCLAGFMRVLGPPMIEAFPNRDPEHSSVASPVVPRCGCAATGIRARRQGRRRHGASS